MNENRVVPFRQEDEIDDPLIEILRTGARRLITRAVEIEFDTFLASNADLALPDGRQRVVRHGHDPVRTVQTGIGPVDVQKPKARDRGAPEAGERLAGAGSSDGGDGDCDIRREIRAEIRQGRRMPDQGSRNAADIFRLSRRSLGPFTDHESH